MLGLLLAAALTASEPSPYFLDGSTLAYFDCEKGTGTGFYIGDGKFVTARHVVLAGHCRIKGHPVHVIELGKDWRDYAIVSAKVYPPYRAIISCKPFEPAKEYYATGYAEGNPWPVTQRLIGTGARDHNFGIGHDTARLRGSTTEGQSGGPVSDDDGLVLGIVSAGPTTGKTNADIIALADTSLCKH